MDAGASGTGRTTFVNTLCESEVLNHKMSDNPESAHVEEGIRIKPCNVGALLFPPYSTPFPPPSSIPTLSTTTITYPSGVCAWPRQSSRKTASALRSPSLIPPASAITLTMSSRTFHTLTSNHLLIVFFPPRLPLLTYLLTAHVIGEYRFQEIVGYLERQYDDILAEESRIKRNPRFRDNRVHALLYFIPPTGHAYVLILLGDSLG